MIGGAILQVDDEKLGRELVDHQVHASISCCKLDSHATALHLVLVGHVRLIVDKAKGRVQLVPVPFRRSQEKQAGRGMWR